MRMARFIDGEVHDPRRTAADRSDAGLSGTAHAGADIGAPRRSFHTPSMESGHWRLPSRGACSLHENRTLPFAITGESHAIPSRGLIGRWNYWRDRYRHRRGHGSISWLVVGGNNFNALGARDRSRHLFQTRTDSPAPVHFRSMCRASDFRRLCAALPTARHSRCHHMRCLRSLLYGAIDRGDVPKRKVTRGPILAKRVGPIRVASGAPEGPLDVGETAYPSLCTECLRWFATTASAYAPIAD